MKNSKYLEYYLDSKKYNQEDVQKTIDTTKKEFSNKDITVSVEINKYGMYVITFCVKNKNTIFNRIRIFIMKKKKERLLLKENNKHKTMEYGQYKATNTYKPY